MTKLRLESIAQKSWFNSAERIELLEREVKRWLGTPFFPNGDTPGKTGGVSCQKLCSEIYKAVGCCEVDVPEVAMQHAQFSAESLVEKFMDGRPEFVRQPLGSGYLSLIDPGDLLGFRFGKVVHHVGIVLPGRMFVHAMSGRVVDKSSLTDGAWSSRLAAVWRPVGVPEQEEIPL